MGRRAIVLSVQYPFPALSSDAVATGQPHPSRRLGREHWGPAAFASCSSLGASSTASTAAAQLLLPGCRERGTSSSSPSSSRSERSFHGEDEWEEGNGCSAEPWTRVLDVAPYHPYSSVYL